MIRILGAGAWGTALAALWSHPQESTPAAEIELIAHTATEAAAISTSHQNSRRLAGVTLSPSVRVRSTEEELAPLGAGDLLVIAVPSDAIQHALPRAGAGAA